MSVLIPFSTSWFGPVIGPLFAVERIPELGPGRPDERFRSAIGEAVRTGFAHLEVRSPPAAKAFTAGLWLLFDFLEESHELSQSFPDEWGAYWHGIMHRREPDPGNAAYWFRRVRDNSIQSSLKAAALELGHDYRDPLSFIQDCERHRGTGSEQERRLREIQLAEIRLLLQHDFDRAVGCR